ncbi:MAG: endonuclease domain-containing protein [Variovorax sp.]|nr:MAG: endonuclease domain-containing protein [Variovorax sp.]
MNEGRGVSGPLSRERERVRVRARALRKVPTDAESLLWFHLRDRRLGNHKFRRQRPVGPYFADFACVEAAAYDESHTRFMQAQGYRVLRFWNNEVLTQTDAVRERILQALQQDPHPNPLPPAGEGARKDTRTIKP